MDAGADAVDGGARTHDWGDHAGPAAGAVGLGTDEPAAAMDIALGGDILTGLHSNDEIPAPAAGFTTVDIHGPFWTTRDKLWTGTITVIARTGAEGLPVPDGQATRLTGRRKWTRPWASPAT